MKNHLLQLLLAILIAGSFSLASAGELDPGLEKIMESMTADQEISVLVYLNEQANIGALTDQMDSERATLRRRHETVVRSLQSVAQNTQSSILSYLENEKVNGNVFDYRAFWITNAVNVNATVSEVKEIAARSDVSTVYFNYGIELIEPVEVKESSRNDIANVEVGLYAVRADEVWAMGFDGTGVLVANMDTGVDGNHPALADRWAGVADSRYQGHPEWAWYDPYNNQNDFPYDNHGHGTHTIGSVTGADNSAGDTIGVAPGAYWIASAPIDRGGGIPRTVSDAILSFQWMTDPDGNPATNWDVPDVCSNSWGLVTGHGYPPCDTLFWSYLDACEAAGTVIIFSAGNESTSGLRRPADRATDDYNTMAVAAVDANQSGWPLASFSSQGPTYCTPDGSAAIKPDIAAPGVDVRSAYPGGSYTTMSGTSMASPHVNGVVALMRQANPNISSEMIKQIIYDTAYDLGSSGEDNQYGWGMIDAYEAVMMALSFLDGYGVIQGQVTDAFSGDPLQGSVTVTNHNPPIVASCNQQGYYSLYVPADSSWNLKAEYPDYSPAYATVSVAEDDTVTQNFQLNPPPVAIDMIPDEYPIYLHAGDSFTYTGVLTNQTNMQIYGDVWLMLDVPGYGMYGPLQLYQNVPLAPGQTITVPNISQYVPTYAPVGVYEYIAIAGDYPNIEMASTSFDFVVLPEGGAPAEVCILAADYTNNWHGARDMLLDDPNVVSVDFIDVQNSTPSLQDLLDYNVLLVWSNYQFADANALGDVLADFADIGGGVVTCEFAHYGGWALGGRYMNEYSPMGVGNTGYETSDIVVDEPNHPIMYNVTSGSEYYDFNVPLNGSNPQLLSHYQNGYNGTIVNGEHLRCVALNNYFGYQHASWTGDIGTMMVNSVVFSANNSFSVAFPAPEGYLDNYAVEEETVVAATVVNNSVPATEVLANAGRGGAGEIPVQFALNDAYPNPFNASAKIVLALPEASDVNLEIYNLAGQKVATLVDGNMEAGYHDITWDASEYSSGIYFYKMNAGDFSATKRMTLLK